MVPVLVACEVWRKDWHGKRVALCTDNQTVVDAWNRFGSRHKGIMDLIRRIYFCAALQNVALRIVHFPVEINLIALALSRLQVLRVLLKLT